MVIWEPYPEREVTQAWDRLLLQARDYNVFQSFGWGEYKRSAGWQPMRFVARNKGGEVVSMAQLLVRSLPFGFALAWASGGPVFQFTSRHASSQAFDLQGLLAALRARFPRLLVRFNSYVPHESTLAYHFNMTCLRPHLRINSGYSLQFEIPTSTEMFISGMTSKHRYYVNKAMRAPLSWEVGCDNRSIKALTTIHREMAKAKGMQLPEISELSFSALKENLGENGATIFTGYLDDQPVTSCLTLDFGKKSFFWVAATGNAGRQVGAAYAMLPSLFDVLRRKGIERFDFGGIAPGVPHAEGVNHFKRGFGGQLVEYLGEWEWASVPFLTTAARLLMKYRGLAA
jgi:lipid II:glycine glycyltransferase (peptidoglycan interpeptide bridge formation enzyme)